MLNDSSGQFKSRSKTEMNSKSGNEKILRIYREILEHAFSDSDYWYLIGNDIILDELLNFDDLAWSEIQDDLSNWDSNQLKIFTDALLSDYSNSHTEILDKRLKLNNYIERSLK